jgi:hypothetical protein
MNSAHFWKLFLHELKTRFMIVTEIRPEFDQAFFFECMDPDLGRTVLEETSCRALGLRVRIEK